jgi:hypothetical protein
MAGLVPTIHVFASPRTVKTGMPTTSAGMTRIVARIERSEIRGGIDASRQSRITRSLSSGRPLRAGPVGSIRATFLNARTKIASLRIFAGLIDFRLRSHRLSTPLRSIVSRQQSRRFNDLQGHRVPNSATAFDNLLSIRLKAKILLTKGRPPEANREVERVRCPRADLQSAPGRLRTPSGRHDDRPARSALDWDRRKTGNARQCHVPGSTAGAERWRSFA